MSNVQDVRLAEWRDLSRPLAGLQIISASAGPGNGLSILAATPPVDYREQASGASFAKIKPDRPQDFTVLQVGEAGLTRYEIAQQHWNYHHVQPLPDDEILLVCARSHYRGPGDYDLNAKVFSLEGKLQREFLLGDGIQDVQVTPAGQTWVSYFDEGVFGNFGWGEPVGASGLIQWGRSGERLYEFSPAAGLESISDCYALNVVSNTEVWCYYYTEFPLVQIRNGRITAYWNSPVAGSSGFLVWEDFVLFQGGYGDRDLYYLVQLDRDSQMKSLATYRLTDRKGAALTRCQIAARGCFLYLLEANLCYRLDLRELVNDAPSANR